MNNCVYLHINLIKQEPFYCGIGSELRPYSKSNRSKRWFNLINKYEYMIVIIHKNLTIEEAKKLEIKYINQIGRRDLNAGSLINMTDGGEGCKSWIPTKKEIQRRRIASAGSNNPMYGKPGTLGFKNKKHTNKSKEVISQKLKSNTNSLGYKHTPESKIKISNAKIGFIVSNKTKIKIGKSLAIPIIQYTKDGKFIRRWDSMHEADRKLNIKHQHISDVCKKKRKSAGSFYWEYENKNIINGGN